MDCKTVEELLPAYALNALGLDETALVESHTATCPWCSASLREHLRVAAALAQAAEPSEPSHTLRTRVMRPVADSTPRRREEPRPRLSLGYLALGGVASIAVVLLAVLIAVTVLMSNQIDDLKGKNSSLASDVAHLAQEDKKLVDMSMDQRSISYVMASPDSQVVSLQMREGMPRAKGLLMISPREGIAILMAYGLEAGSYHVWLKTDGQSSQMGDLWVDDSNWGIVSLWPSQPITFFQNLVVTDAAPDATAPDGNPVIWGSLTPE